MRAIILAADDGIAIRGTGHAVPKCLVPIAGKTILEHQMAALKEVGITDVTIVVGAPSAAWTPDARRQVDALVPRVIENPINRETKNGYSLHLGLSAHAPGPAIVLDGDVVFRASSLKALLDSPSENVLLVRPARSVSEKGAKVETKQKRVIACGETVQPAVFPWDLHSGILKIGPSLYGDLQAALKTDKKADLLAALTSLLDRHIVTTATSYLTEVGETKLRGGSYAQLSVLKVVRKQAGPEGKQKILEEANWLMALPEKLKPNFPEIYRVVVSENEAFYEMPFYEQPSLRQLLFYSKFNAEEAATWLDRILRFMYHDVYPAKTFPTPRDYVQSYHMSRIWERLKVTAAKSPTMSDLIQAETVTINGKTYRNMPILVKALEANPGLLRAVRPKEVSKYAHSDLHFDNILIDLNGNNFKLVDPRGYEYCDPFYDLGKIWHSVNGLYDFFHEGFYELDYRADGPRGPEITYRLKNEEALAKYADLKGRVLDLFAKHCKENDWRMKVAFNEVVDFCSVMPFHMKGEEPPRMALGFYAVGVELADAFLKTYGPDFAPEDWININDQALYEEARKVFQG